MTFSTMTATTAPFTDAVSSSSPPIAVPTDLRCRYAYKECKHPRSQRKNGKLHSLCEFHRRKANSVQKQYAMKRRNMNSQTPNTSRQAETVSIKQDTHDIVYPRGMGSGGISVDEETYYRLLEIKQRIQDAWERRVYCEDPLRSPSAYYVDY
ncbi:hypothetical protein LEN26_011783 [Aphanomyces euteiches]|nr:hypothetical protein AeMF1_019752 [Aphanomyces euteiches]KAH9119135.1 hypothetical protein LEN26_011783 [Aphanomyces euteiches]KAH9182436.1 hypothetical protein AeNC1_015590 [Aphanomyces euteiches]